MKMLSVAVENSFAKQIDELIEYSGFYSSRSEFLKDSIRKNLAEITKLSSDFKKIHVETEKLSRIAKERGWNGEFLTREEKAKLADEFLKEKNIK